MTSADGFNPAKPDGRWARVLRVARDQALTTGAINKLVRRPGDQGVGHRMERLKTMKTIRHLVGHGLLARTDDGFITTHRGLLELSRCGQPAEA